MCWIEASYRLTVYEALYESIHETEGLYLDKYLSFESRYDSLLGLALAKYVTGNPFAVLCHDEKGKPYIREASGELSITHSSGIAAAAWSEWKIGIDLEKNFRKTDVERLAAADLFGAEGKAISLSEWTALWTKLEAYVKMLGSGFLEDPELVIAEITKSKNKKENNLFFYTVPFKENMTLSICSEKAARYTIQELSEEELVNNQLLFKTSQSFFD